MSITRGYLCSRIAPAALSIRHSQTTMQLPARLRLVSALVLAWHRLNLETNPNRFSLTEIYQENTITRDHLSWMFNQES
jgi:hypothetical protein